MRGTAALGLSLAAACSSRPAPPPAPQGIETAGGRARLLAEMKPDGDLPIDRAIAALQRDAARLPKSETWVALGYAWVRKARDSARPFFYAHAGASADLALELEPGSQPALDLKGLVLMNDHRFEEARQLAAALVARRPNDPVAWGTLSDALLELGHTDESVQAAQRMMDLKPNLPSYSRAAHLQWLRGDLAAARESVRLAIDAGLDGKDKEPQAWVLVQAGMMFWNEGDAPGAEAGFDLALQRLPEFPPALVGRARVLLGRGDGAGAAALLERAWAANPLPETGWLLGDAREAAGDVAGARRAWAEVDKRGRADPRTLALFWATKDRDRASALKLALAERAVRDDLYTEDVAAWALYRAGRLDEAFAASERALRLGTRDARLWFHAGAIRVARGDLAGGRALLRKALALNPHFDRTGEAEARRMLGPDLSAQGG